MNSRIFKSISDRQNIANAYSRMCESEAESEELTKEAETPSAENGNGADADPTKTILAEFPTITDDALARIDLAISDYVGAEDVVEDFTYLIPDIEIGFHVENDGIGRYEYWGHEEYDRGHNYAVIDGCADDITEGYGDKGFKLAFDDDEDGLSERAQERFQGEFDWEDEDGHGTYSSFSTSVRFKVAVTDAESFVQFVRRIAEEKSIPLDGSDAESANSAVSNESVDDEYADEDAADSDEGWKGRGRNVKWNYIDILKYTKSLNTIKEEADDIIYHKLWDLQFSEGNRRSELFKELRSKLDTISREAGKWSPNKLLPGYSELMSDLKKLDGMD